MDRLTALRVTPALALLASAACATPVPAPDEGPPSATVFAPGVISTGNVYRGSFAPDGREFYFFKRVTDDPRLEEYRIFMSRHTSDGWTAPDTVSLGGVHSDLYPSVHPSGELLVFSSYRPAPGDTSPHPSANLWAARREGERWGEPFLLAEPNSYGFYHSQLAFTSDGVLHFKRSTWDYREGVEMETRMQDGVSQPADTSARWLSLRNAIGPLHLYESMPGTDDSFALLTAAPVDTLTRRPGPPDLHVVFRTADGWTAPRPLQADVNSPLTENFPFFSADGRELFFVRDFRDFMHVDLAAALGPRQR